jgi:type I restriction-modification system DNA methylase subunit
MIKRSKERIDLTGEVFTPLPLVDEVLAKLPEEVWATEKTFIDPAAGDGNFLVRVFLFKLAEKSTVKQALETIYGVELMPDNVKHCKQRLLDLAEKYEKGARKKYQHIVDKNIVCADSLKYDFSFE